MLARGVLFLCVAAISGPHPLSLVWAAAATRIVTCHLSAAWIVALSNAAYLGFAAVMELTPGRLLQGEHSLAATAMLPRVLTNLASTVALGGFRLPRDDDVSHCAAAAYLALAVASNEVIYATVHRLLHTRALYPIHALHHTQVAPRAFGAAYCSLTEMWVANLSSLLAPLYLMGAPSGVLLVWIVSAVQGTLSHHSGKTWLLHAAHQPRYHDAHHKHRKLHYGNIGFMEAPLRIVEAAAAARTRW